MKDSLKTNTLTNTPLDTFDQTNDIKNIVYQNNLTKKFVELKADNKLNSYEFQKTITNAKLYYYKNFKYSKTDEFFSAGINKSNVLPENIISFSNIYPKKLFSGFDNNILSLYVIVLFIIFIIFFAIKVISKMTFKVLVLEYTFKKLNEPERKLSKTPFSIKSLFKIIFILSISLFFVFLLTGYFGLNFSIFFLFLRILGSLTLYYIWITFCNYIFGFLFKTSNITNYYNQIFGYVNSSIGILILPFLIFIPFSPAILFNILIYLIFILFLLFNFLRLFYGYRIHKEKGLSIINGLIYFTIVEVIPFLFIIRKIL